MTGEIKDGPFERYHENGQLWNKGTFTDGERHGPWESYHENGQLWWKGTYNENERVVRREPTRTESARCGEWMEEGETITYDPCPPDLEGGN